MNTFALLQRIWLEIQGFVEAVDERAYIAERITVYFNWAATKAPIPAWSLGPILWIVDMLYTAYANTEPDVDVRKAFWAKSPAPPVVKELLPAALSMPIGTEPFEKGCDPCDGSD